MYPFLFCLAYFFLLSLFHSFFVFFLSFLFCLSFNDDERKIKQINYSSTLDTLSLPANTPPHSNKQQKQQSYGAGEQGAVAPSDGRVSVRVSPCRREREERGNRQRDG